MKIALKKILLFLITINLLKTNIFQLHSSKDCQPLLRVNLSYEHKKSMGLAFIIESLAKYYFRNNNKLNELIESLNLQNKNLSLNKKIKFAIIYSLLSDHEMINNTYYKSLTNTQPLSEPLETSDKMELSDSEKKPPTKYRFMPEINDIGKKDIVCLTCYEEEKCMAELACHPNHKICFNCLERSKPQSKKLQWNLKKNGCPYSCNKNDKVEIKKYHNLCEFTKHSQFLKNTKLLNHLIFEDGQIHLNEKILNALILGINSDLSYENINLSFKKILDLTLSRQVKIHESKKRRFSCEISERSEYEKNHKLVRFY